MKRILVTGAVGQIGSELTLALRDRYGGDAVVASDVRMPQDPSLRDGGPFEFVDCMDPHHLTRVMQIHRVDTIYHLAALLSAVGEQRPLQAWQLNVNGLVNVLEAARQYKCALFFPSSIGAFGPDTPRKRTPQVTIQRPTTMYGGTNSQSSDSGRWSYDGARLTAHSRTGKVASYALEKRNHPKNKRDPMICLDGKCYVTYYNKPAW